MFHCKRYAERYLHIVEHGNIHHHLLKQCIHFQKKCQSCLHPPFATSHYYRRITFAKYTPPPPTNELLINTLDILCMVMWLLMIEITCPVWAYAKCILSLSSEIQNSSYSFQITVVTMLKQSDILTIRRLPVSKNSSCSLANMTHVCYMCDTHVLHVWCCMCITHVMHTPIKYVYMPIIFIHTQKRFCNITLVLVVV